MVQVAFLSERPGALCVFTIEEDLVHTYVSVTGLPRADVAGAEEVAMGTAETKSRRRLPAVTPQNGVLRLPNSLKPTRLGLRAPNQQHSVRQWPQEVTPVEVTYQRCVE
ncbi:hypothetical protein MRX96_024696 [Rhipicephalus microplus]